jgi:5,10-methylenetetrahydromethanopterin reductase
MMPVQRPSFGVELHEYLDAPTIVAESELAEALGYDTVWLGDSQLIWRETYALLGAVAVRTSRIRLGPGVTNPLTRHVGVVASALVTLQELSGNRVIAGVGLGDSAVRVIGAAPASMAALTEFVSRLRGLSEGSTVSTPEADLRLVFGAAGACPPVVIAASGPRMLRLAGAIGDGAIVTREARAGETLNAMLASVQEGREEAGATAGPFWTCLSASVAVHPDRTPALQAVRPHVASTLRARLHWPLSPEAEEARDRIAAEYDFYRHMDPAAVHAGLVPDTVVTQFAIAGTAEDCIEQAVALFEAGIDEITIRPYGVAGASRAEMIDQFAQQVVVPVNERLGRVASLP